ncbi:MAG: hypothetical protein J7M25_05985 [Deltaproteobacteria bacterium]|nr:hypothetical protein [Deltaproteobacteria bacterium]
METLRIGMLSFLLVLMFVFDSCSASMPSSRKAAASMGVCQVQSAPFRGTILKSNAYVQRRQKLIRLKLQMQRDLNHLVRAYRRRFDLDIRAARFLKKKAKLARLRGAVISEDTYRKRLAALDSKLAQDVALKQAVEEQSENTLAYRVRKQTALLEYKKIAMQAQRLQGQLAAKAQRLDLALNRVVRGALRRVLTEAFERGTCEVVCDGKHRSVLIFKGTRKPPAGVCGGALSRMHDLTGDVIRDIGSALRAGTW